MTILRNDLLIPLGGLCLAAALLIDRFLGPGNTIDLVVGVLTGLSIALNLLGLYRRDKSGSD